jgi:hypothetical protein
MRRKSTNQESLTSRAWTWIKNHKIHSAFFAIILALIGVFGQPLYQHHLDHEYDVVDDHIDKRLEVKLSSFQNKLSEFGERISKMEGQLSVLVAQKSIALSGVYARKGDIGKAVKEAADANVALTEAIRHKVPVPLEYFHQSVAVLDEATNSSKQPNVLNQLQKVRLSLAQYHSALEVLPHWMPTFKADKTIDHEMTILGTGLRIRGFIIDGENVEGDLVQLGPIPKSQPLTILFDRDVLKDGTQTLDDISWQNVLFIGMHIRYEGGPVELKNVTFVNCTFDAPNTTHGRQVVNYAALGPSKNLTISQTQPRS